MRELWSGILDLIYPPCCLVCRRLNSPVLCASCIASFAPVPEPVCPKCGGCRSEWRCKDCATGIPRYTRSIRAMGVFDGALRTAILLLKYGGRRNLATPLALLVAEHIQGSGVLRTKFDAIVPVPLHAVRRRQRGYNQSELVAASLSDNLGIPLMPAALVRIRPTKAQAGLGAVERSTNLRGAFAVSSSVDIKGMAVLIVDDVITTCSTVDECARILRDSGARAVHAIGIARDL